MSRRHESRGARLGGRPRDGAVAPRPRRVSARDVTDLQPHWPDRLATLIRGRRRGGRRARGLRLLLAAALVATAGVLAVMPEPATAESTAVALTRDLPAGAVLSRSVLRSVALHDLPDGAIGNPADAVGRTLAAPARRGEIVTDVRLVAPDGPDPGPGRAAVPIRPADAAAVDLLSPGMHVAIVTIMGDPGGRSTEPTVLAADAVVLSIATPADGDRGTGRLVLVAVPLAEANRLAAAALGADLAIRFG